jgi:hypothetical protein
MLNADNIVHIDNNAKEHTYRYNQIVKYNAT